MIRKIVLVIFALACLYDAYWVTTYYLEREARQEAYIGVLVAAIDQDRQGLNYLKQEQDREKKKLRRLRESFVSLHNKWAESRERLPIPSKGKG